MPTTGILCTSYKTLKLIGGLMGSERICKLQNIYSI